MIRKVKGHFEATLFKMMLNSSLQNSKAISRELPLTPVSPQTDTQTFPQTELDAQIFQSEYYQLTRKLWHDPTIKEVFSRRRELQLVCALSIISYRIISLILLCVYMIC